MNATEHIVPRNTSGTHNCIHIPCCTSAAATFYVLGLLAASHQGAIDGSFRVMPVLHCGPVARRFIHPVCPVFANVWPVALFYSVRYRYAMLLQIGKPPPYCSSVNRSIAARYTVLTHFSSYSCCSLVSTVHTRPAASLRSLPSFPDSAHQHGRLPALGAPEVALRAAAGPVFRLHWPARCTSERSLCYVSQLCRVCACPRPLPPRAQGRRPKSSGDGRPARARLRCCGGPHERREPICATEGAGSPRPGEQLWQRSRRCVPGDEDFTQLA